MWDEYRFFQLFQTNKPIIGMLHLAGLTLERKITRAFREIDIFEGEGLDGVIVENYHGSDSDLVRTLEALAGRKNKLAIGVNILPNEFEQAITWGNLYGAKFIQIDYVAGRYQGDSRIVELDSQKFLEVRSAFPNIVVLGGVHPKYYHPVSGSDLPSDLRQGRALADAIVVTGRGTGQETPIDKIKLFRKNIGDYPLVVGAGLTPKNVYGQLQFADGGIVGSSLKIDNNTNNPINRDKVKEFMDSVKAARDIYQESQAIKGLTGNIM